MLRDIERKLRAIHEFVCRKGNLEVCVHTSDGRKIERVIEDRLDMMSNALKLEFGEYEAEVEKMKEEKFEKFIYQAYFTVKSRTNQVVESFLGVPYAHKDYPLLTLVSELLSATFLHQEVRVKGGARGTGVITDPHKGTISLYSQKDPLSLPTYISFEKAVTQCAQGQFE